MAFLTPDSTSTVNGVATKQYLLTNHNPNRIAMPQTKIDKVVGITIHNTDWIIVSSATTPAEQYTRATVNGNMNDVRVHYYIDDKCAWQNLPLDLAGWHAADGSGDGNRRTIAIECIMSRRYDDVDKKAEDNCARLAAYLLAKYNLSIDALRTHTYWMNVRDGKKGSTDELNVMQNRTKMCPAYILPHWQEFKNLVQKYLNAATPRKGGAPDSLYRVRKSWQDVASQTGAYSQIENAVNACVDGYNVYDSDGIVVYTHKQIAKDDCPYAIPTFPVKITAKGDPAKWVQWQLTDIGYSCGGSGVDGDFGKDTERGLRYFQKVNGLEVDGVCGPATRSALLSYTTSMPTPDPSGFTPRFTKPEAENKYYIRKPAGYSTAIKGLPTDPDCDVLANCVGFAHSRFHEIARRPQMDLFDPVNAENIYENAKAHGLQTGDKPKLGAMIVWQKGATLSGSDGAGHVAVVEQINADGSIVISQSGWNASKPFWTQVLKAPWYYGAGYKFLGFVYNPSVK